VVLLEQNYIYLVEWYYQKASSSNEGKSDTYIWDSRNSEVLDTLLNVVWHRGEIMRLMTTQCVNA